MSRSYLFHLCYLIALGLTAQSSIEQIEKAVTSKDFKVSTPIARELVQSEVSMERGTGYWALGVAYLGQNPDSSNYFLDLALDEDIDEVLELRIVNAKANYYDIVGSTRKAIKLFLLASGMASRYDSSMLSGIYNNLSIAYRSIEQFDSAVFYGFEGLKHAQKLSQSHEEKRLYNSIAIAFAVQDDLEIAGTYFKRSLMISLGKNDSTGASKGFVNLVQLKVYQNQLDSAMYFLRQAEVYNIRNRNALDIMDMYALMAEVKLSAGSSEEAIDLYKEALNSISSLNYPSEKIALLLSISEIYLEQNQTSQSQQTLNQAKVLLKGTDALAGQLTVAKLQKALYVSSRRYQEAIGMDADIEALMKQQYDTQKLEAVEEIRAKYETEKKEQLITSLQQEAKISALRLRQQAMMLVGGGAFLIIFIFVGVVVFRNRSLLLTKQRLLVEQKLLRSQMNPHFLFNALTSIHSFILKGDRREASEYLTTFSELTRDILDLSEKDWITLDKELVTLSKYIDVQKMRFPTVDVSIEMQPSIDQSNVLFPPLLLQPFVENAFEHGFKGKEKGLLYVSISSHQKELTIEISDDGNGLSKSTSKHDSKAILIAKERLDLLFGKNKCQLTLNNREDQTGVLATIVIPKEEAL